MKFYAMFVALGCAIMGLLAFSAHADSDMKEVIIGSSDATHGFTGTYTRNPLLVNIAAEHIHNDIYLYKLETKFGKDFWEDIKVRTLNEEK